MDAVVMTVLIGAFVCGGVFLEAVAPHLPGMLGLDRTSDQAAGGHGAAPQVRTASHTTSDLASLERRVDELQAERDFYKALAEPRTEAADAELEGGRS
jgi:hypothetical protein